MHFFGLGQRCCFVWKLPSTLIRARIVIYTSLKQKQDIISKVKKKLFYYNFIILFYYLTIVRLIKV